MEREDDVQLIRRVLSGDDAAFDILVEKYEKGVHALAWRKVGDFHYAEEITQDAFLQAYKKLSTLKNPHQFAGWLYVIANRLCIDWMRKQKPTMQSLENIPVEEIEEVFYRHHVSEQQRIRSAEHRHELVKKLLEKLPESERTVVTLYYLGEMTTKEIGKFLGVSVKTISSRLRRARERLKQKEDLFVQEFLGGIKLSGNFRPNIMRQVADLKPTPTPVNKPLLPWAAFGVAGVLVILMLSVSNQYLARFQKPYSFEAASEPTIQIVEAPIVLETDAKPALRNQIGQTAVLGKSRGVSLQVSERDATPNASEDSLRLSETQWMPDANLREAVRQELEMDTNIPLTEADMLQLVALDTLRLQITEKISDLTGLEHAINLEVLLLPQNRIQDIRPLANLTKLTFLDLGGNAISDVSLLAGLVNLEVLGLWSNQIVDVSPLARLVNLKDVALQDNQIADVSSLVALTSLGELNVRNNRIVDLSLLTELTNIEVLHSEGNPGSDAPECELPRPPIIPRIEAREYPSVFGSWSAVRNRPPILPRLPWLSADEPIAYFDLYFCCPETLDLKFKTTKAGVHLIGDFQRAKERRDALLAFNPNAILLVPVVYYSVPSVHRYPEDGVLQDLWLRDENGNRIVDSWGNALLDFTLPETQKWAIDQAKAITSCGLFDGIFLDHWSEGRRLREYRTLEAEHVARDNILQGIRAAVDDDFLIMVNANEDKIPRWAEYVNGTYRETIPTLEIPLSEITDVDKQYRTLGYSRESLPRIEEAVIWSENHLREPRINGLTGLGIEGEPPDSPRNKQWMRIFTTLSLTHSDGYVEYKFRLFSSSITPSGGEPVVHWHPFWDAPLGRPVGEKAQLYHNSKGHAVEGLFIREFTNGWAVYNRSGKEQKIRLPGQASAVASGIIGVQHYLSDLDGEIYLK